MSTAQVERFLPARAGVSRGPWRVVTVVALRGGLLGWIVGVDAGAAPVGSLDALLGGLLTGELLDELVELLDEPPVFGQPQ